MLSKGFCHALAMVFMLMVTRLTCELRTTTIQVKQPPAAAATLQIPTLKNHTHKRLSSSPPLFKCLEDREELWQRRIQRVDEQRNKHCHGEQLDKYAATNTGVVPVLFIYSAQNLSHSRTRGTAATNHYQQLALAVNTAARFNDVVILLMIGNITQKLNVTMQANVQIYHAKDALDPVYVAFESFGPPLYKHYSTNTAAYEMFCIRRWFAALRFLELHKHSHVFMTDNDVLLLTNVTRDAQQCYSGCNTFGYLVYSMYMQIDVMRDFVNYINNVYDAERNNNTMLAHIKARYPVVSDMTLHLQFTSERHGNNEQSKLCSQVMSREQKPTLAYRVPFNGQFYELGSDFRFVQDDLLGLPYLLQRGGLEPHLYQNLHFQGISRKRVFIKCV